MTGTNIQNVDVGCLSTDVLKAAFIDEALAAAMAWRAIELLSQCGKEVGDGKAYQGYLETYIFSKENAETILKELANRLLAQRYQEWAKTNVTTDDAPES